ncbi:odorant receptor Or1-like isoform X2 [Microplitis mediator]|nr:odorant receptor Or1-like isoform X2 [Microplitis mediator]
MFGPFRYHSSNVFLRIIVNLFKFVNLVMQVSVIMTTGIDTIKNINDIPIVSTNICYVFPMTTILTKATFSFFNEQKMKDLIKRVYKPIDTLRFSSDIGVLKIIRTALSYQFFDSAIYIFVCVSVSASTFLLANYHNRELPIRGVFPINSTDTPSYQIIYVLQVYAILVNCVWVYSFDMILLGMIRWMTIDLKILQLAYRMCPYYQEPRTNFVVPKEGFSVIEKFSYFAEIKLEDEISRFVAFSEEEANVKEDSFLKRFLSCVVHQRKLIANINDTNDLFSVVLFVQTFSNCSLTCMGLFGLVGSIKKHRNPMNDLVMLQIGFLNLLYWCVFGHFLIVQHDCLMDSIYESGWERHLTNKKVPQLIINTILHGMQPIVITAGHFFDLSMKTYLEVLNKSYSFFAILNTVTTEDDFE